MATVTTPPKNIALSRTPSWPDEHSAHEADYWINKLDGLLRSRRSKSVSISSNAVGRFCKFSAPSGNSPAGSPDALRG